MYRLCRHIFHEGRHCKGPAVDGSPFCRHHGAVRTILAQNPPTPDPYGIYKPLPLVFPEDRAAVQTNLFLVLQAFNDRKLDFRSANFMTYNLQVAMANLGKTPLVAPDAVQRVILTPEGDEIAPPRETLEPGESPLHHKDCPCQRCAEQFRGAPPEQHHADCRCGLCEPARAQGAAPRAQETSDQRSAINDQETPQLFTQGCHPERTGVPGAGDFRATGWGSEGPAVCKPATDTNEAHETQPANLSPALCVLSPVRTAHATRLYDASTKDPINREPNYNHYLFGDQVQKHEAQYAARSAIEAGLEPPPYEPLELKNIETEAQPGS
jgi:hypothetical protein